MSHRVQLRRLSMADIDSVYNIHSDELTMRYGNSIAWASVDQAKLYLQQALNGYRKENQFRFAIERIVDRRFVGVCSLLDISREHRRAEIGYVLDRNHTGHGYMTEAIEKILVYAFTCLDLNRIQAEVDPDNQPSIRLLNRYSFRHEGRLREHCISAGTPCDSMIFGLLASDWTTSQRWATPLDEPEAPPIGSIQRRGNHTGFESRRSLHGTDHSSD